MGHEKYSKINTSANWFHVEPNSHFWTDLNQIIVSLEVNPPDKEYILIGLNNCIKNGYKLKRQNKSENVVVVSVEKIIAYVKSEEYNEKELYLMLNAILRSGYNLTNGRKMERQEVYNRINGERDYQDMMWSPRREADGTPDEEKPVAEWINYIEYHISKAKERVYHLDTQGALAELRKVSALGVRAMEIHGCPERIIKADTAPNGDSCSCNDCKCEK